MRITPLDIQQRQFSIRLRGFHAGEVATFLEQIREEIEELLRENAALKVRISEAESEIQRFGEIHAELARTLQEARQIADEARIRGRREADDLLADAEEKARRIVSSVHEKALKINEEIVDLKMMRRQFHEDMRAILADFSEIVDDKRSIGDACVMQSDIQLQHDAEMSAYKDEEDTLLPDEEIGVEEGHEAEEAGSNSEQA